MCIGKANGGKTKVDKVENFIRETNEWHRVAELNANEIIRLQAENDRLSKALEKQIPKKVEVEVVEDFDESTGEHYKWRIPKCSVCGEHIGLRMHKYCAYCGHALDWSDTE